MISRSVPAAVPEYLSRSARTRMNMFEEAEAIKRFIADSGLTQQAAADALGCSQSYVANKLRLLKLPPEERDAVLDASLSERHARAIIRIGDGATRRSVTALIVERRMNVATAEEYVEAVICSSVRLPLADPEPPSFRQPGKFEIDFKRRLLLRDMRLFFNSIDHAVDSVRSCGFCVLSTRTRTDDGIRIDILIKNEPGEKCFT